MKDLAAMGTLFEGVPDAIVVADVESRRIVLLNAAAEDLFGYPASEALGMHLDELVPEALEGVETRGLRELAALKRGGEEILVEMSLGEIGVPGGSGREASHILAIMRDVTERRRHEEELRRSEAQYRVMVERARDLILIANHDNTWRYANPAVERLLGYKPEELSGKVISEIVHPDDIEEYIGEIIEKILSGQISFGPLECRYLHKDGSYRRIETYINNLIDDPDVRGVVGISRDVTEQRELEEAVRESEEWFRALTENALDIVMVADPDNSIRYINPAVKRILGYDPEEMIGTSVTRYLPPDDLERAAMMVSETANHPGPSQHHEFLYRHKDGTWRYIEGIFNNLLHNPSVRGIVDVRPVAGGAANPTHS